MLRTLHIENIAVVKSADIELGEGFNVLTGETGAGKSVIIDSINMLTGAKVSRDVIRSGESFALSEAVFDGLTDTVIARLSELGIDCDDGEAVITCKMNAEGKMTNRINGRSVTRTALRDLARLLISIHGQNDSQMLFSKTAYFELTDSYGECSSERETYREIYHALEDVKRKLRELDTDEEEKARRRDMLEYQLKDIDSKKLKVGEEEALESEKLRLKNIEKINKHINFADRVLSGGERGGDVAYMLSRVSESLSKISDVIPDAASLAERLMDMSYEVSDVADEVKKLSDMDTEDADARLDKIESRLEVISSLKKRYGRDIESILEFRRKAAAELDSIESADENAEKYRQEIEKLEAQAKKAAKLLSEKRIAAAKAASEGIMRELSYLDMPKVKFAIEVTPASELSNWGADKIEFLVATNPGEPMMPIGEIASGGEMARIMLAIRSVLNEKDGVSCSVYDEIDTGISGKTSRKVGVKLHSIARESQVICVTHSAQIATLADTHFLISKEEIDGRAHTSIRALDMSERIEEAARILGGINITDAQRQAAKDMIENTNE